MEKINGEQKQTRYRKKTNSLHELWISSFIVMVNNINSIIWKCQFPCDFFDYYAKAEEVSLKKIAKLFKALKLIK